MINYVEISFRHLTMGYLYFQASNFLRAFRTMPQVSALGLVLHDIDENTGRVDFPRLIQSWQRFVLMQIHKVCGISFLALPIFFSLYSEAKANVFNSPLIFYEKERIEC